MRHNFLKKITSYLMLFLLIQPVLMPLEAMAQTYDGVREMDWSSKTNRCEGGGWKEATARSSGSHTADVLDFNPFGSNMDINWELSNGVCATYIAGVMATLLAFQATSFFYCTPKNPTGALLISSELTKERASAYAWLTPMTLVNSTFRGYQCGKRTSEYYSLLAAGGPGSPSTILAAADMSSCCISFASYAAAITAAVGALAIIYGVGQGAYKKARICGHDWTVWNKIDDGTGNLVWKRGAYSGSHKYEVERPFKEGTATADDLKLSNQDYREYIFGGEEFKDNGEGACKNPWNSSTRNAILGYDGDEQRYYMTGPGAAPVFACYRFLMSNGADTDITAGQAAYDCCINRSQSTVCIENAPNVVGTNDYEHVFCEIGKRCDVKGVWFDAYASLKEPNYACAKTYSVCPYNHPLGGGTETQETDPDDLSSTKNYCQFMAHCSKLPIKPYVVQSSLTGGYFDSSCRDLKGDSQNVYGYASNLLPVDNRNFSAPMAQCFKETMQNVFFNIAGHTECADSTQSPDADGVCSSGYKYREGDSLSSYQQSIGQSGDSFFVKIQNSLQSAIKMALSVAIIFFGMSVLIGVQPIGKKKILTFILKIGLVMYFAIGDAWQAQFMNGIIGSSVQLSQMMFGFDPGSTTTEASKLDGCQFPKFNYADSSEVTKYDNPAYPSGREYLIIWDTLDCKIARALGYGIEVSVPNLVMMILGGFFTGGAGIVFLIATFAFAFFLMSVTIRGLHIFLMSIMSIVILSYVSPIMVTLAMFARTKGIFDKWWKQILGFALQPMILFAYMGVFLTFFDNVIIGDATFIGDGRSVPKQIVCEGDAKNTSIYCIFNPPVTSGASRSLVQTYDALKMLGIGLPVIASLNQTKITALIKAGILLFILSEFMDKITSFAAKLVGGSELKSNTMSASAMMSQAGGLARGAQKRGMGMLQKNVVPRVGAAMGMAKRGIAAAGNRGKSAAADQGADTGGNKVGSSPNDGSHK